MQRIRRAQEAAVRACQYGELVLVALAVQSLIWFQSRLFPQVSLSDLPEGASEKTENIPTHADRSIQDGKVKPEQRSWALPGQATLEWVLIGGIMVVIIVGLLITLFQPQLEAIVTNILNLIQQNTGGQTNAGIS